MLYVLIFFAASFVGKRVVVGTINSEKFFLLPVYCIETYAHDKCVLIVTKWAIDNEGWLAAELIGVIENTKSLRMETQLQLP